MTRFLSIILIAFALSLTPASAHLRFIVYATTQTSDATAGAPTNIAGLSFVIGANVNTFARCYLISTSANATTGIRYAVTGPASPTAVTLRLETWTTTALLEETYSAANFSFVSATDSSILTTRQVNQLDLMVRNGANAGTIAITIDPEASTSVTAEIGSWCEYSYEP